MNKKQTGVIVRRAKKLGYVTFKQMHQEFMRDKKFRGHWKAAAAERAIRMAIIGKRIQQNLTQAQIAKRANMQQSAVARFETGEESPTLETTSRILAAVGAKIKLS